jgi:hypothetical protein
MSVFAPQPPTAGYICEPYQGLVHNRHIAELDESPVHANAQLSDHMEGNGQRAGT